MFIKPIQLGNLQIDNNIFLAPMAGYTDYPFREVALKTGYGLCFTELVSAKGLLYGGKANSELVYSGEDIDRTAVQIFGSDPESMRLACQSEYLASFKIIDINMGCPVPKVFKNGDGSALLCDIKKAEKVVKACVSTGKLITVKIRTGLKKGDDLATEYCKMAEDCGAKLVTIHGRVRESYYSGEPDYNAIYKAKRAVDIPIIANGGIFTEQDAQIMMDRTGADGIMLARGSISDPFLCSKLLNFNCGFSLKEFILRHLINLKSYYPERRGVLEFRKFVSYYFKGVPNIKELKQSLFSSESFDEITYIIQNNL